jgi:hypothetical protein
MKKPLLYATFLLFLSINLFAQAKPKVSVKKVLAPLEKILSGTGLPYEMNNDSLAVIPYKGENIKSFTVIIQAISDLYIVYVDLSESIPTKITEAQYKYLLETNNNYDVIKIGMTEDGGCNMRVDLYKAAATTPILKRIITQVANVTNIMAGDLK